jgi:uncharacterized membrane protein (UPF0127 family)
MKAKRRFYATALLVCLSAQVSLADAGETIALSVNGKVIRAELAQTVASRAKGLMFRKTLCANCGMLFVFPSSDKWSFWSKNTPLALSVAFVDGAGRIVQIVDMETQSTEDHVSKFDALYALEMKQGWFASNGIAAGYSIKGLAQLVAVR